MPQGDDRVGDDEDRCRFYLLLQEGIERFGHRVPGLTAYIHLNPVGAGMTARLQYYPWSSHRAYLGLEVIPWLAADASGG